MVRSVAFILFSTLATGALAQEWQSYGGNAQHSGQYMGSSQTASLIHWQAPLEDNPSFFGVGSILTHYACPMVTPSNTVVYALRFTANGTGASQFDNWRVMARNGSTGAVVWQYTTDYSAAAIFPSDWTTVYPATLYNSGGASRGVAAAGSGGSVLVRPNADASTSQVNRYAFYTTASDFAANQAAYSVIKINTPLTADKEGNIYFGYYLAGSLPSSFSTLAANLGTGGVAKVNALTGQATYKSVQTLALGNLSRPAMSAAPALSADETALYIPFAGGDNVLARLNTSNLSAVNHTILYDPSISGAQAYLISESSASPMVGPDGHVFMGVFGNQWRESHGWMLQFDANLSQTGTGGKRYPVGAFGWDDTPSVVPSNIVQSYHGTSRYLILCKYNNYDDNGGDPNADGSNKVAVLDPGSDAKTKDRQSGIPVMNEVLTVLGPTRTNNDSNHPDARTEWCINAAAIDIPRRSAILNSEDGHMYRWNFTTNTLTEGVDLQPATGEAYTSTAIGPDGTLFAINNAILFAVGSTQANAVSVYQGTAGKGTVQDVWYLDGQSYSTNSVPSAIGMTAAIEADFTLNVDNATSMDISASAAASPAVTGQIFAYSYTGHKFVQIGSQQLAYGQTSMAESISSNAAQFIGPGGAVRILIRGVQPSRFPPALFTLAVDLVTCGAH